MDATARRSATAEAGEGATSPEDEPGGEPTRLLEFLLGAVMLFAWAPPGAPSFLSVGLAAVAALVALATVRRPVDPLGGPGGSLGWLVPFLLGLLAYLTVVSITTPDDSLGGWPKRALRLVLVLAYLVAVVGGRLHYPSLVRGAAAGLLGNAVLFFAGVAPAPYGQYLSGYLLDKNQAGLSYTVVGLLLLGLVDGRRRQLAVVALTGALVWATGSRTSIAALVCGLAWFTLRPYLGTAGRLALVAAFFGAVQFVESRFSRVGVFVDRDGSDAFRQRIDDASMVKLDSAPFQGLGLGESWVDLEGRAYLFHNSYWAALVEGGWVLLAAYLFLTALVIGVRSRGAPGSPWLGAQAANIAVLVCALRLGEVFGATTAVTALAGGLLGLVAYRRATGEPTPAHPSPHLRAPVHGARRDGPLRVAPDVGEVGRPGVVSLNEADETELVALPGIGPVLAGRIVARRTANGPFTSVDEITEVRGIGVRLLARIRSLVAL